MVIQLEDFINLSISLLLQPLPVVVHLLSMFLRPLLCRRLGHVPLNVVSKISSLELQKFYDESQYTDTCYVCPLAKQFKLPFPLSQSQDSCAYELIHCDLWGPYKVPTCHGCKFFLTIVVDFSRDVWTILIPTKQHVIQYIKDFFPLCYNSISNVCQEH